MDKPFLQPLAATALAAKARWVWEETLRLHARLPETRLASSLSCVEILCSLFYGGLLRFRPGDPRWAGRDRFIISKGHGSISFYPILADLGFIAPAELEKIGQQTSVLKAIPDTLIPGYETINGSVGQGLSTACGIALALRQQGRPQRVFVLCGDGELHEGSNWEAIMFAAQHGLTNLCLIIDDNQRCMLGPTAEAVDLASLPDKMAAFHWEVATVAGHDLSALPRALDALLQSPAAAPRVLIARTIKGHGIPALENDPLCHIRTLAPAAIQALLEARP